MLTTDITNQSDYKQIKIIIKNELESIADGFISLGFYLKKCRDEEIYKEGDYKDIFEFAEAEYNLSKSVTSRFMSINDQFSIGGNSPEIAEQYRGYGSSKLSEMLTLDVENYALVDETTTISQLREMKKEFATDDNYIPGQIGITNYPEYCPENANCDVATNMMESKDGILFEFVKWYFANEGKNTFENIIKIINSSKGLEEKAEEVFYKIAPSKFRVFKIPMANVLCNTEGIAILELGQPKKVYSFINFIEAFMDLFEIMKSNNLELTAEEIYKKYYNVELNPVPVKVEIKEENLENTEEEEESDEQEIEESEESEEELEEVDENTDRPGEPEETEEIEEEEEPPLAAVVEDIPNIKPTAAVEPEEKIVAHVEESDSKENMAKLLDINAIWLVDYLTDMITECDEEFLVAIESKDRESVESIIERYIY